MKQSKYQAVKHDFLAIIIQLVYHEFFWCFNFWYFLFQELERELRRFEEHNSSNNTAS
jgi:hypothetical protein